MAIGQQGKMSKLQIEQLNNSLLFGKKFLFGEKLNAIELTSSLAQEIRFDDNEDLKFGTGTGTADTTDYDVLMQFDGTQLEMLPRSDDLCAFNIGDGTTDMDFKWFGGTANNYVEFNMGNAQVNFEAVDLHLGDTDFLEFGDATAGDFTISFDGTNLEILPTTDDTGAVNIGDGTTDADLKVFMGSTGAHVLFDNGSQLVTYTGTGWANSGTVTTGISLAADGTTALSITNGFSGTNAILIAGTAADTIKITGAFTGAALAIEADGATGISITNAFSGTTGLSIAGTTTNAISITGAASGSDIVFQNGATIKNDSADSLTITEATITTVGKLAFGGNTDWGTGATGTVIDGSGYDWVSQTVGRVNANLNSTAAAAAYLAMTVTASQTTTNSVFGLWSELYITGNSVDLTGSSNYASVWGNIEISGTSTVSTDSADFMCGVHASITTPSGYTNNTAFCGVHADCNVDSTITNNGRFSAFECKKTSSGESDWDYGLYAADCITTMYVADVGTTSAHVIDMADAYLGKVIETGTYQSSADGGVILSDSNTRPVSFLFDDSAAALTGNNRAVLSRVYLAESQGAGGTIVSIQGQLKIADDKDFSAGRFCGVDGYLEFGGSTDINSGAYAAAMNARVDVAASETVTVKSGGYLAGLHVHTTGTGTLTQDSGCVSAAILVNDMGTVDDWDHGLYLANCGTGITIGACATDAISISGTFTNAASRGVKSVVTVNNANYGDGYSANDFEFHMTGTVAGHVAAGGMWVNIDSGTHDDSNFICAQTNGVYQAAGSITGKRVIFGMRMAHQCTNNGSTYFFPFSIVAAGGLNSTTALFHTNAAAINMGEVTNAGSDDGKLVPLYWEGDGANIGYVKIYSLA